jgi:hypothetical protein
MQATKVLPQIDPQVVAACKERDPNFGKGGRARTQTVGRVEVPGLRRISRRCAQARKGR